MAGIPHSGRVLLSTLKLTPEVMRVLPKVPISSAALCALIRVVADTLPFDETFYAKTYPDVANALASGAICGLREHFIEHGYLEGRLGTAPEFDVEFYLASYPDVAAGIQNGEITSALDHYIRSGASEGRFANTKDKQSYDTWREFSSTR